MRRRFAAAAYLCASLVERATAHRLSRDASLPWLSELINRQTNLTLVDIGACEGDFKRSSKTEPVQFAVRSPKVRAILVEPNPRAFKLLHNSTQGLFGNTSRIQLVEAAITANSSVTSVPFYVLSPNLVKGDLTRFLLNQVSSMSREEVVKGHKLWNLNETEFDSYVQELRVPTKTPLQLLKTVGVHPSEVDVLKVDAEGFDASIVNAFLDIPGFSPKAIVFEEMHMDPCIKQLLLDRLLDLGYQTDCKGCRSNMEFTALRAEALAAAGLQVPAKPAARPAARPPCQSPTRPPGRRGDPLADPAFLIP